jgi:type IV pilus assembly protein PilW
MGFTLVELLVSGTVTVFVIALILGIFVGQQRSFAALDLARQANERARDALLEMEPPLRRLGFGVEPRHALDFAFYACPTTPCVRDRASAPDELVFYARNPAYRWLDDGVGDCAAAGGCFTGNAWTITSTSPFVVNAREGDVFHKGRVMLVSCAFGASLSMFTLAGSVTAESAGPLTLPVAAPVAGNPYRENLFEGCLGAPGSAAFFVDRYRYFIRIVGDQPYLSLDTGLDLNLDDVTPDAGDARDVLPVAEGIEDLQVAYVLNPGSARGFTAPDADRNWVVGDTRGTEEQPDSALAPAPVYSTPLDSPARYTLHPANIRAVRLSLGLRALRADDGMPAIWLGDPFPLRENRSVAPSSLGRVRRYTYSTTVTLRDMDSRGASIF